MDSPELQELPITKQSLLGDSKKCVASNLPVFLHPVCHHAAVFLKGAL
ncbi:hypothetical protein PFLCHA0_c12140 [Pseudomonas protegens CHA0]|uniref:Uncharacterized protein n=1 Tax=Pseudomonas protegens (strain DSM 19095 / LMG 27888 / CFBP 6595 / CHA0) TaxID=1124983 RepID=A0A2C9EH83_PSEPH|nr:hypothetical protein PFLCHA0_c12140 [Pseudomonas protegens CHA0]